MNRPPFLPHGLQLGRDLRPEMEEMRRTRCAQFGALSMVLVAICVALAFLLAQAWDETDAADEAARSARCSSVQEAALSTTDRIAADQAILAYRAGVRDEAERQVHGAAIAAARFAGTKGGQ